MDALPRIRASQVARSTGLTVRAVTAMAQRGAIPSAAKLGKVWTFDPASVTAWIRQQERTAWQNAEARGARDAISTSATGRFTHAFKSPAKTCDEAYIQAIGLKHVAR